MQAEQVSPSPTERVSLHAPRAEEGSGVADRLLPAVILDVIGTPRTQRREDLVVRRSASVIVDAVV
jgi:hypothetical protein